MRANRSRGSQVTASVGSAVDTLIGSHSAGSTFRLRSTAGMIRGMGIVLAIIGVLFAALCVWLTVRTINRRERWAKWTLLCLIAIAIFGYPLSAGPFAYLGSHGLLSDKTRNDCEAFYRPITWLFLNGPKPVRKIMWQYFRLWWPNTLSWQAMPADLN